MAVRDSDFLPRRRSVPYFEQRNAQLSLPKKDYWGCGKNRLGNARLKAGTPRVRQSEQSRRGILGQCPNKGKNTRMGQILNLEPESRKCRTKLWSYSSNTEEQGWEGGTAQ